MFGHLAYVLLPPPPLSFVKSLDKRISIYRFYGMDFRALIEDTLFDFIGNYIDDDDGNKLYYITTFATLN